MLQLGKSSFKIKSETAIVGGGYQRPVEIYLDEIETTEQVPTKRDLVKAFNKVVREINENELPIFTIRSQQKEEEIES